MKIVLPAKAHSGRVPNKNWRPFHNEKSLVEIKIEQLLKHFKPEDIFLSCDGISQKEVADRYRINFMHREAILSDNITGWADAITGIISQVPCDESEDILWTEATSPLFDEFLQVLDCWHKNKCQHDSLLAVSELRKYFLNEKGRSVNYSLGRWHCHSQDMEPLYMMDGTAIMSKKNMLYFNYTFGKTPFLYKIKAMAVDIDTMDEFRLAQILYQEKQESSAERHTS